MLYFSPFTNTFSLTQRTPGWRPGRSVNYTEVSESDHDICIYCHAHVSGYLVHIGSQQEQNCLLKFGHAEGYRNWYWTDGKCFPQRTVKYLCFFIAHEVDTPGVYIHGSDNNEVTWFSPKMISYAGDAILLGIFTDANKGAWYEHASTGKQLFICEAQM